MRVMVRQPDPNSMLIWWPKVADLDIPKPKTVILDITAEALCNLLDGIDLPAEAWHQIDRAADQLGYPLFMRTDLSSGKHDYRDTCYVESRDALRRNLWRQIEANMMADIMGLPFEALVLRQYIPLATTFTAFRGLPIAPERRYFISDGEVVCWHHYWPEAAIESGHHEPPLPPNWRSLLSHLNTSGDMEQLCLTHRSRLIAERLEGYWSVDFARAPDYTWYFIDAARGERSWHPEDCPFLTGGA